MCAPWANPGCLTMVFKIRSSESHIMCTLIECLPLRFTYSYSVTTGVCNLTCFQSTQPITFGNPSMAKNNRFCRSASHGDNAAGESQRAICNSVPVNQLSKNLLFHIILEMLTSRQSTMFADCFVLGSSRCTPQSCGSVR